MSTNDNAAPTNGDNTTPAPSNASPAVKPVGPATPYAKPFPDISKIEVFNGKNYRRWEDRLLSLLDLHGVASALTDPKPDNTSDTTAVENWNTANKVCRHTILSTLSNELFDVYCSYKDAKKICDSINLKYTAEDAGKQKFVISNFYKWEMTEDKDVKSQINEYHKLIEDLKGENIELQDEFIAGILIEKLPESWKDYKQQLKHKHKQLSLGELITHIIIEDTNRREIKEARAKALAARANLIQNKTQKKRSSCTSVPTEKEK